jgi:hypothetical protein
VKSGKWKVKSGKWKVESEEWKVESEEWKVESDGVVPYHLLLTTHHSLPPTPQTPPLDELPFLKEYDRL